MKSKDIIVLKKILDYCNQVDEACAMFSNDYNLFVTKSVFQNACCMCILQIGELCKVVSQEFLKERKYVGLRASAYHKWLHLYQ